MKQERKNSLYIQGSILALAGIITKIIGFVYRIPVANLLGEEGSGVYAVAFYIYNIALTLSSYSLPLAVSKMISARLANQEYKNVRVILRNAIKFALIAGTSASLILFIGADLFEVIFNTSGLARPLRILAPTVFIVSFLGVFRGFFQGQGTMVPTAISQVIEQIINAIVSIVAAVIFTKIYAKSEQLDSYGATGSTLGTLSGAFAALILLLFVFHAYKPSFHKQMKKQTTPVESDHAIMSALIRTAIPVIISQTIYQIGNALDSLLFAQLLPLRGVENNTIKALQGIYSSQYTQLVNLPVAIATAMASSSIPAIVRSKAAGNRKDVLFKSKGVMKFNMIIAFPCAVGLSVLAYPITHSLYPRFIAFESVSVPLLQLGSIAVIFYALSTITTSILQANNYMKLPVIHSGIALVIHLIVTAALLAFTDLGIFALMIGNLILPILVCIMNLRSLKEHVHFRINYMELFGKPALASLIMGLATFISYKITAMFLPLLVAAGFSMIIAVIVYFFAVLKLNCFTPEELIELPFGSKIMKLFHLS